MIKSVVLHLPVEFIESAQLMIDVRKVAKDCIETYERHECLDPRYYSDGPAWNNRMGYEINGNYINATYAKGKLHLSGVYHLPSEVKDD
jgi:hypothetical protein